MYCNALKNNEQMLDNNAAAIQELQARSRQLAIARRSAG